MRKIAAIVQARMSSTRLPNKVLTDIEGKPLLWHLINRIRYSKHITEIIIATSNSENDKAILVFADQMGIKSYAGKIDDVLDRYYQAALENNIDIIIRITADCPLLDPIILDKIIQMYIEGNCDYVSNTMPPSFPDGLDVEVFSFEVLIKAWKQAKLSSEREHVTPYIRKNPNLFKLKNYTNDEEDLSYMRWTVDEKEDLEFIRKIYKYLFQKKEIFLMKDILELLKNKPELMKINNQYSRNEGYSKSLQEDKIVK